MKITTEKYTDYLKAVPKTGKHILAHQRGDQLVVYQAYKHSIANFAVKNKHFGGSDFSFDRMSWIKPNFLWMMYRCGWAEKINQERVLAIYISKIGFEEILSQAAHSSYKEHLYETQEAWKQDLAEKEVRLQWDPDHNPYGEKEERKAIQLGLKGAILQQYSAEFIQDIEDITAFVKEQKVLVDQKQLNQLKVPKEEVFLPNSAELCKRLDITI